MKTQTASDPYSFDRISPAPVSADQCTDCRSYLISLSFFANVIFVVIEGFVGIMAGSHALVAGALHSLSDTTTFGLNYFEDRRHLANVQKVNPGINVFMGVTMFIAGAWICARSVSALVINDPYRPGLMGLSVAAISVGLNWYLWNLSKCVYENHKDQRVNICKIQNTLNFFSAVLTLTGVLLADLGFVFFDPLFAVFIALTMIFASSSILRETFGADDNFTPKSRMVIYLVIAFHAAIIIFFVTATTIKVLDSRNVILIPSEGTTLDSKIDSRLGRSNYFIIYDIRTDSAVTVINTDRNVEGDVSHNLIGVIDEYNVGVVIAPHVGKEVFDKLVSKKTAMYYDGHNVTVNQALQDQQSGLLEQATINNVDRGYGRNVVKWLSVW
ncbi:MAG: cation transporter [SAR324 cluster bacterium]|nr:cation transporter [SAR324 cluster bacterium]